jgi:hemoglobin-like flavoprotein
MTPRHIALVQASFAEVTPRADTIAALFSKRLVELDPTLHALFPGDLSNQGANILDMVAGLINDLPRLDGMLPTLQRLGRQYQAYGVLHEHYATVGEAWLWTLAQSLGERFATDVRIAWTVVYSLLAITMDATTLRSGPALRVALPLAS